MSKSLQIKQRGLAISVILLAVVLLAAIAVTIATSSRSGSGNTAAQQNKLLATTILNQAQQIQTGFDQAMSNGLAPSSIDFTQTGTPYAIAFLPSDAGIPAQIPPPGSTTDSSVFAWILHGNGALIKLMNIGTGAGNYVLELDPLTQGVCEQINQVLSSNTAVPELTTALTGWDDYASPVDASADPAVNNKPEACVHSSDLAKYLYYKTLVVQ